MSTIITVLSSNHTILLSFSSFFSASIITGYSKCKIITKFFNIKSSPSSLCQFGMNFSNSSLYLSPEFGHLPILSPIILSFFSCFHVTCLVEFSFSPPMNTRFVRSDSIFIWSCFANRRSRSSRIDNSSSLIGFEDLKSSNRCQRSIDQVQ